MWLHHVILIKSLVVKVIFTESVGIVLIPQI